MSAQDLVREPLTGINVVIVGGGIGGMATAIECHRKGHNVRVFERKSSFETFGDLLGIGKSAQRAMLYWPGFLDRLLKTSMPPQLTFYKYDGTKIVTLRDKKTVEGLAGIPIWRSKLHGELYKYVEELGIQIFFDKRATKYFETEEHGGVIFQDDQVVLADLVVAADGIASKSSELVVQNPETPTSSGYSIYRVSFPLDHALKDPVVREHWGGSDEGCQIFLAENLHIVTAKSIKTNSICWMMTHKDTEDSAVESWSADCPASNALNFVPLSEGWAPYIAALIKMTPNNRCVNWKLVWRSPQQRWSSPKYRILQLGDACHPFIPTSGSGAVMAMEDGYSLATCLQLCGRSKISLGVQVHNKLRFERVAFAQRMGFDTREFYHHPSWSSISQDPGSLGVWGPWIFDHDAEKYAYENYARCVDHILHGTPFRNTNTPPGKTYEPWTISGLLEEAGKNGLDAKL